MSQREYLKTIERELQRINQKIDLKIIRGEDYKREARDHRLLLRKISYLNRQNLFRKMFPTFSAIF
ncbi:MAG TPA: hypothetical protein VG694_01060 [Candidatus Paceibacterota bacterium]|nr:hypothetical protein [Candidatus Paceibacterota bacterium]